MGSLIDQLQKNNRDFISEKARRQKEKEQKAIFENHIYKKIYHKFLNLRAQGVNLEKIRSLLIDPFIKKDLLKGYEFLQPYYKSKIYDQIVKNIYNQFYYIDYESIQEQKENKRYYPKLEKEKARAQQLQEKRLNIHKSGFLKIAAGLAIGGRLATKENKKQKNSFYK